MNNTWHVGQKVSTYCTFCNERLQTFVKSPNGSLSRNTHMQCDKEIKEIKTQNFIDTILNNSYIENQWSEKK